MPSKRPKTRLQDIVKNIYSIQTYTHGLTAEAFMRNRMVHDAVERCLSRISEAASKLGPVAAKLLPQHNWLGIRDIGNILRHEYDNINDNAIWAIVSEKLPSLCRDIEAILPMLPEDEE